MLLASAAPLAHAGKKTCIVPNEALAHVNKNVCVTARVYRVVDTADGTHFLDVCSPKTADIDCHFFIVNFSQDEKSVGDLQSLAHQTIHIRGTVHTVQGRADIVLSSKRQLHGGKEKFQPNPQLVKSFSAENGGQAFNAKNGTMGQHGVHFHHRGN
ncbi:MAG: hypothetical protein ACYDC6_00010 [Acidobacteriaceae bacterium]